MIVLGIVLLLLDMFLLETGILNFLGIVLIVVGVILTILGAMGRAVGGRTTYF